MAVVATVAEMQKDFERYVEAVLNGDTVVVTKDEKEVGRFMPKGAAKSYLTDSLIGLIKNDYEVDAEKEKSLREKYAGVY